MAEPPRIGLSGRSGFHECILTRMRGATMGFTIQFTTSEPVEASLADAISKAARSAIAGRSWLSCEPPLLQPLDGRLFGFSKPNLMPHPDDVASASSSGLPDGTLMDLLDILSGLSREFGLTWEITSDASEDPIGEIQQGVVDDEVIEFCAAFGGLSELGLEGLDPDDFDLEDL